METINSSWVGFKQKYVFRVNWWKHTSRRCNDISWFTTVCYRLLLLMSCHFRSRFRSVHTTRCKLTTESKIHENMFTIQCHQARISFEAAIGDKTVETTKQTKQDGHFFSIQASIYPTFPVPFPLSMLFCALFSHIFVKTIQQHCQRKGRGGKGFFSCQVPTVWKVWLSCLKTICLNRFCPQLRVMWKCQAYQLCHSAMWTSQSVFLKFSFSCSACVA